MFMVCAVGFVRAQNIVYSEPDRDDERNLNFSVVGKIDAHYLVLKNVRNDYAITVFDEDMKQVDKVKLTFLPDRVINAVMCNWSGTKQSHQNSLSGIKNITQQP